MTEIIRTEEEFKKFMDEMQIGMEVIDTDGKRKTITDIVKCGDKCSFGKYCKGRVGFDNGPIVCRVSEYNPFYRLVHMEDFIKEGDMIL